MLDVVCGVTRVATVVVEQDWRQWLGNWAGGSGIGWGTGLDVMLGVLGGVRGGGSGLEAVAVTGEWHGSSRGKLSW